MEASDDPKPPTTSQQASAMANARWAAIPPEERSRMARERMAKLTPEERQARTANARKARHKPCPRDGCDVIGYHQHRPLAYWIGPEKMYQLDSHAPPTHAEPVSGPPAAEPTLTLAPDVLPPTCPVAGCPFPMPHDHEPSLS